MDGPQSHNQQYRTALDHQLDEPTKRHRPGQMNGFDIELEFLEDNENRWDKIFDLLETEDHAQ